MTLEMIALSVIILIGVALFAFEVFPVDKVSFLILSSLVAFGLIHPEDAVSGFGNPATITVGCLLALSFGIEKTGALNLLADRIIHLAGPSEIKVLISIMITVGILSAFINNTAAVAIFLPLCLAVAREQNIGAGRLLMPMSFTAILAGTCTLIGTSTNLLVDGLVQQHLNYSIGMFELAPLGLVFFGVGTLYLLFVGRHMIRSAQPKRDLTSIYEIRDFVTELIIREDSLLAGKTLPYAQLGQRYGVQVIEVWRDNAKLLPVDPDLRLESSDILLVQAPHESLLEVQQNEGVILKALKLTDWDLEDENLVLVEAYISPSSRLVETSLKQISFRTTYGSNALAIRRHGRSIREKIGTTRLQAGDSLLVLTTRNQLATLRETGDFLIVEELRFPYLRKDKASYALVIFLGVIVAAASEALSTVEAALVGVGLMTLFGCVRVRELYANLSWTTLVMLGCLIPLGTAMERTGLAALTAQQLVDGLQDFGPVAVLSGIYILTSALTEVLSNNASAVLMVPISIAVAAQLGVSPMPFIFAVMFAASASFMTPVGYQTNTMVFGPGGYTFSDFVKVGTPLNLLLWLLATLAIPLMWPF